MTAACILAWQLRCVKSPTSAQPIYPQLRPCIALSLSGPCNSLVLMVGGRLSRLLSHAFFPFTPMELSQEILNRLDQESPLDTSVTFADVPSQTLHGALASLSGRGLVTFESAEVDQWRLSEEGELIVREGSHEAQVFRLVQQTERISVSDIEKELGPFAKAGQGKAMRNKWIRIQDGTVVPLVEEISDTTRSQLQEIQETKTADAAVVNDLRKRKLIRRTKVISYTISKGPQFTTTPVSLATDLTAEMIQNGSWKTTSFKPYNFNTLGAPPKAGALHPLAKVRSEFRQIFFEMGFEEMETNQFVESGFWNFDTLFVPQQHPARDMQDTFYISDPQAADLPSDKTYFENIRQVHQDGKYGSVGYRYPWNPDEAQRLVLRTHTTAISTAYLYRLAQNGFKPAKYFSIDRVFRNESVDATHLAEFHQIEGVIADYNLTLGDLIGFMRTFFAKMNIHQLRFKPAYNPYTEPSMEIFGYHPGLKRWVEIGNSGMFRPEMLESMGLPKDVRVHGWGLSLERPTMIKYGVSNIRELLGHKVDLDFIENNPAVRFEKN